jgi:hypothetical protein
MTDPARTLLVCAAALLDQGRTVDRLSRPLTTAALIGLLFIPAIAARPPWMLVGVVMLVAVAGLVETYFAIRVGFDAALFRELASASAAPDFAGTDAALSRLGVLPAATRDRPAAARVAGARRLFRWQILGLAAQVLSVLAGGCIARTWR